MNNYGNSAVFIIPHYGENCNQTKNDLRRTMQSIYRQTDSNWKAVIVDDNSPSEAVKRYLKSIADDNPEKVKVIFKEKNEGAGFARNTGIKWAYDKGYPFILFNDADDLSHEKRLETVRNIFMSDPNAGVVYSSFLVIDEYDNFVPRKELTPSIVEILEGHEINPVQGYNSWIQIGTRKGYTNCTSGTAVKTEIAYANLFPKVRVSEDSHTWMRYSATGTKFVYSPEIPFLYRIPSKRDGSASREREGGKHEFYVKKAEVDEEGFREAMEMALQRDFIEKKYTDNLMMEFYLKLAETLAKEKEYSLAIEQVRKAMNLSRSKTQYVLSKKPAS